MQKYSLYDFRGIEQSRTETSILIIITIINGHEI